MSQPVSLHELSHIGAVYVSTEDAFPNKRWQQLATQFASKHGHLNLTVEKLSNSLFIEHAATVVSSVLSWCCLPPLHAQLTLTVLVIIGSTRFAGVTITGKHVKCGNMK